MTSHYISVPDINIHNHSFHSLPLYRLPLPCKNLNQTLSELNRLLLLKTNYISKGFLPLAIIK
jgi:hypothetical protein